MVSKPDWDFYSFAFEESGIEVYKGLTLEAACREIDKLGPIDRSKLETRRCLQVCKQSTMRLRRRLAVGQSY
jgi:hypothetical protein